MTPGHARKPCFIFALFYILVTLGVGIEKGKEVVTDLGAEIKTSLWSLVFLDKFW